MLAGNSGNALPASDGQQDARGRSARQSAEVGAHCAQRTGAVLCAGAARPRPLRQLYGFPQTDLREFRLGPRAGGLGLFADLAGRRADGAGHRPAVRPLRPPHSVFAWAVSDRRRIPGGLVGAGVVAIAIEHRPLRRHRRRLRRQCAQFDPARPVVRSAPADSHGFRLFRDGRGRPGVAAGVAASDRSCRLARRLPALRDRHTLSAAALVATAVALVRQRRA